jgi:ribose transport system permease protein/putative xylitol transport system permease protein
MRAVSDGTRDFVSEGAGSARQGPATQPRLRPGDLMARYAISIVFFALLVVLLITSPEFRQPNNLWNVLQQNAIIGIVACGMLVMMIAGGFDLSVGAVGSAAAVVAALGFINLSIPAGVLLALVVGLAVGTTNGLLITKVGINPFVTTLGMAVFIQGLLFVATDAKPVYGLPPGWTVVGLGKIGPVPIASIIFAIVAGATWFLLRFSRFGHYVYAVGGNKEASRLAGVPVDRVLIGAFALGGFFAAIAGLVLLGQVNIGQPAAVSTWPLTAIAACVVGGTSLSGGVGTLPGAVVGTLLLGVVANALNLFGVSPYWQPAVTGVIILSAVGIDSFQRKRKGGVS